MATYSNNTTIEVSGAIAAQATGTGGTLYTCPANSYAIINLSFEGAGVNSSAFVAVAGVSVKKFQTNSNEFYPVSTPTFDASSSHIYVGPGQAVTYSASSVVNIKITGVQFSNSP